MMNKWEINEELDGKMKTSDSDGSVFHGGLLGSTRNSSGGDELHLVIQKDESFLVETAVGVVLECLGLAAVNVDEPVADESDLVEELQKRQT